MTSVSQSTSFSLEQPDGFAAADRKYSSLRIAGVRTLPELVREFEIPKLDPLFFKNLPKKDGRKRAAPTEEQLDKIQDPEERRKMRNRMAAQMSRKNKKHQRELLDNKIAAAKAEQHDLQLELVHHGTLNKVLRMQMECLFRMIHESPLLFHRYRECADSYFNRGEGSGYFPPEKRIRSDSISIASDPPTPPTRPEDAASMDLERQAYLQKHLPMNLQSAPAEPSAGSELPIHIEMAEGFFPEEFDIDASNL